MRSRAPATIGAGARTALAASIALLLAIGVLIFVRRLSGALEVPLAPIPLAVTATGLLAWASAVRLRLRDRRIPWLLALVLGLFAVACSYPAARAIDWLVWLGAFAVLALTPARRSSPANGSDLEAGQILQQLSRSRGAEGSEIVHGTLLAEFAAGERIAVLHVAFCPPFERLPSVEAEIADGPACDVKIVQVLHQGPASKRGCACQHRGRASPRRIRGNRRPGIVPALSRF